MFSVVNLHCITHCACVPSRSSVLCHALGAVAAVVFVMVFVMKSSSLLLPLVIWSCFDPSWRTPQVLPVVFCIACLSTCLYIRVDLYMYASSPCTCACSVFAVLPLPFRMLKFVLHKGTQHNTKQARVSSEIKRTTQISVGIRCRLVLHCATTWRKYGCLCKATYNKQYTDVARPPAPNTSKHTK